MDNRKQQASVTVPFCLIITLMVVLIFTLVEGARYYGLKTDATEWTNLTEESLFAGYQPFLLEQYDLFFLDGGFGTGKWKIDRAEDTMQALLYDNLMAAESDEGINLYRMEVEAVKVTDYMLATDDGGKVFEVQAAKTMKNVIGERAAKKILENIKKVKSSEEAGGNPEQSINNANQALEELANQAVAETETNTVRSKGSRKGAAATTTTQVETPVVDNPLEEIESVRAQGILALVLPKGKTVSGKTISVDNCLLKRNCQKGTFKQKENPGWYERILMQEYVKPLAGNFLEPRIDGALSYGTEYLICGEDSDEENLKKTVNKLLLIRECINFVYLQKDSVKIAEAAALATVIAGASANPVVIEVVKQGLLAVWAYAESVCDVKALLSGGKVPLMKTSSNWKTQLSNIGEVANQNYAGESQGLSYENYLDALLYSKSVKQIAYRSMDLMEKDMQKEPAYANCRMDHMIVGMKIKAAYKADTIFLGIMGNDTIGSFSFERKAEYVYQ